jgi:hypothetical protein
MSKAFQHAELIRTRLMTAPATGELPTPVDITDVDVIVYRQKEVNSQVNAAVAKAKGTAIVIVWQGFRTLDANAKKPRLTQTYNITVWSKPIIAGDELKADDVMESIIARMWHWIPVPGSHTQGEAVVEDGGLVPDKTFLKYDCEVTIPTSL